MARDSGIGARVRTGATVAPLRRLICGNLASGWFSTSPRRSCCRMFVPGLPLPVSPVRVLEPFRIADQYGLFAVMTHARYEIEFQGSRDGKTWIAYPFRYKPQDVESAPGIYAPYQPRFDWNLWFASLGRVAGLPLRRLDGGAPAGKSSRTCCELFAGNPFDGAPPAAGARRDLSILVHGHEDEARDRRLVAARGTRRICASARARARRQNRHSDAPLVDEQQLPNSTRITTAAP